MTYRHITTKNYVTYDIKFSHIVAALNDSAIVEPTQPTELRCDHLQCPILKN